MIRFSAALVAVLLVSGPARAQAWRSYVAGRVSVLAAASCETAAPVAIGHTQGYADALGSGLCFASIHPMDAGMVYRDYAVFSDGMLMVFSSYGEGESPDMTSAREYYFFPRRGPVRLKMDSKAGTVSVVMPDGGVASFDPSDAQISGLDRGAVTVSPRVDRSERGGVEVPEYRGLMLDAGFRLGELPSGKPDGTSTFRSAEGQLCTVRNDEIFSYSGYDSAFKLDDAALSAFLKKRCPGLHVGF